MDVPHRCGQRLHMSASESIDRHCVLTSISEFERRGQLVVASPMNNGTGRRVSGVNYFSRSGCLTK